MKGNIVIAQYKLITTTTQINNMVYANFKIVEDKILTLTLLTETSFAWGQRKIT